MSPSKIATPTEANLPLQFMPFTKEHFASEAGINTFNQQWQQAINAINAARGHAGPVVQPSGIDMAGSTITGLAAPSSPTDAVSAGHAASQYGAPVVGPQLDIGGSNSLKGLAYCYQQVQKLSGQQTVSYTSGNNYVEIGGVIFQWGHVTTDINNGTLPVTFQKAFPTAAFAVVVCTLSPTDRITYVVNGSLTQTGFTIANNGSSGYAYWMAVGN